MFVRLLVFILVALVGYFAPFPVFLLAAVAYLLLWPGYELFIVAVCIDAQFGAGGTMFGLLYTGAVGALVIAGAALKPHIRFYHFNS